jgi:hypothetical protein
MKLLVGRRPFGSENWLVSRHRKRFESWKRSTAQNAIKRAGSGNTSQGQSRRLCLESIRRHLAPGGLGAIHLAMIDHPDKMVDPDELERTRHIKVRAGSSNKLVHWEIIERKVDLTEQILEQEIRHTYRIIDGPILRTDISTYRICWITRREAQHLFARCGLVVTAAYSDFVKSPPRLDADHIILFRAAD